MNMSTWRYEKSTRTIRSVPENYWLASMNSWDNAVDHDANAALISAIKLPKSNNVQSEVMVPNYCDRCQSQDIAELLEEPEHIQSYCSIYPESVRDYLKYVV
jgi:hypothetical protein